MSRCQMDFCKKQIPISRDLMEVWCCHILLWFCLFAEWAASCYPLLQICRPRRKIQQKSQQRSPQLQQRAAARWGYFWPMWGAPVLNGNLGEFEGCLGKKWHKTFWKRKEMIEDPLWKKSLKLQVEKHQCDPLEAAKSFHEHEAVRFYSSQYSALRILAGLVAKHPSPLKFIWFYRGPTVTWVHPTGIGIFGFFPATVRLGVT